MIQISTSKSKFYDKSTEKQQTAHHSGCHQRNRTSTSKQYTVLKTEQTHRPVDFIGRNKEKAKKTDINGDLARYYLRFKTQQKVFPQQNIKQHTDYLKKCSVRPSTATSYKAQRACLKSCCKQLMEIKDVQQKKTRIKMQRQQLLMKTVSPIFTAKSRWNAAHAENIFISKLVHLLKNKEANTFPIVSIQILNKVLQLIQNRIASVQRRSLQKKLSLEELQQIKEYQNILRLVELQKDRSPLDVQKNELLLKNINNSQISDLNNLGIQMNSRQTIFKNSQRFSENQFSRNYFDDKNAEKKCDLDLDNGLNKLKQSNNQSSFQESLLTQSSEKNHSQEDKIDCFIDEELEYIQASKIQKSKPGTTHYRKRPGLFVKKSLEQQIKSNFKNQRKSIHETKNRKQITLPNSIISKQPSFSRKSVHHKSQLYQYKKTSKRFSEINILKKKSKKQKNNKRSTNLLQNEEVLSKMEQKSQKTMVYETNILEEEDFTDSESDMSMDGGPENMIDFRKRHKRTAIKRMNFRSDSPLYTLLKDNNVQESNPNNNAAGQSQSTQPKQKQFSPKYLLIDSHKSFTHNAKVLFEQISKMKQFLLVNNYHMDEIFQINEEKRLQKRQKIYRKGKYTFDKNFSFVNIANLPTFMNIKEVIDYSDEDGVQTRAYGSQVVPQYYTQKVLKNNLKQILWQEPLNIEEIQDVLDQKQLPDRVHVSDNYVLS